MTVQIIDPPAGKYFPYDEGWQATALIDSPDDVEGTLLDYRYNPPLVVQSKNPFCTGGPNAQGLYTWIVPFPPNVKINKGDPLVILCFDSEGTGSPAAVSETASENGTGSYFLLKLISEAERRAEAERREEFDRRAEAEKWGEPERRAEAERRKEFDRRIEAERREREKPRDNAPSLSIDGATALSGDDVKVKVILKPAGTRGRILLLLMNPATRKILHHALPIAGHEGQEAQEWTFPSIHAAQWTHIQVIAVTKGHVARPQVKVIK